jgi:PAS domain S-box-containing protein
MNKVTRRIATHIALRVSLLYALFGGLWILLSDRLLEFLVSDVAKLSTIQTYKGWAFVGSSALLIYSLLRAELHLRSIAEKKVLQLKRLYATLSQVNQMIVRVKERDDLFQTICNVVVQYGEFPLAWIGLLDEGSGEVRPIVSTGLDIAHLPFPHHNIQREEFKDSPIAIAFRTSKVTTSDNIHSDSRLLNFSTELQAHPYHAAAVIPFQFRNRTIGALIVLSNEKDTLRDEAEIRLLNEMGLDISFALDNMENEKERKQAESEILSVSRFPGEDPNPVLRISAEGTLLYANHNSQPLLDFWKCKVDSKLPDEVQVLVSASLQNDPPEELEIECQERTYSMILTPIWESGYINAYGNDITERKLVDQALRASEERFRLLFEKNHSVMMLLDPVSGSIRDANAAATKFYGYSLSELRSMKIDQINDLTADEVYEERMRALKEERNYFNFRHRLRNGESRFVEVYSAPIEVDKSTVLFSIIHDITERKNAEDQLRQSEERYRLISENTADVIWVLDPSSGHFTYISPSVEKLRGYTPAEVMSQHVSEALTAESFQFVSNELSTNLPEFLSKGEGTLSFISEVDQPCKDGSIVHTEATTTFMFNSQGQAEVVGVSRNINERKHSEQKLRRNEQVLRLFVEHSPASIAMLDRDMRYIIASQQYLIDYRLGEQGLTGRSHYDVFPEISEHWKEIHRRCLQGAIEKADEDPFPRQDGTLDWVRWEIHPWYEETGHIGGIILFSEVITDRKKVQDELHLLNLQLEQRVAARTLELSQANRAKDEFLANMSHELRTPLNTVLGLSETLLEQRRGPLNEKQVHSIDLIASSGRHLLSLINDILEVSKIEAGKLALHPAPVSVKELCEASLNFVKEMALNKRINLQFDNDESVPIIIADAQRIKQILLNLLMNAVKFTPERGRVSLQVYTSAERDRILFSITDTGIGILQKDLKKLFTPFTQLDSSLARQYAGTGLGLALVQKLTDLHGGSVQVESEPGQGSRFTVILPLNPYIREQPPIENVLGSGPFERVSIISDAMLKQQGSILLAEDNEINSRVVAEYLMSRGYTVFTAQNGEEVLEKAAQKPPGIILMDIQMPKMDGLEAMRRLREDPRFASTPIIALTALAMPGDRERCLEAGANEYMSKPVSLRSLVHSIQRLVGSEK